MSSFTINDDITLTSSASIDNIRISGNTISSTNTNGHIVLAPNGNGNVGIGTSSPGTRLQVNGYETLYDSSLLPDFNTTGDKVPAKIILGNGFCPQIRTFYPNNGYTDAIDLEFWTSGQNIGTDDMSSRLTIKAQSGNVGIGTTSPAAKLDVAGTLKHQGLTLNEGTTPNVDEVKTFGLFLTVTTSWSDTGINGNDLSSGTYILNMVTYATTSPSGGGTTSGALEQYDMTYSGILSWYSGNTEDNRYNEILLHNSGRSTGSSNNVIFLRTIRVSGSVLKLQIRSSLLNGVTPDGTAPNFTFKFRRMI